MAEGTGSKDLYAFVAGHKKQEEEYLGRTSFGYTTYDSPLSGYGTCFNDCLPGQFREDRKDGLKNFIEATLGQEKGVKAVDLGGPGTKLFTQGFSPGFIEKSVGVELFHPFDDLDDLPASHSILLENIFNAKTPELIMERLGNQKVDLLMERMQKSLENIPSNSSEMLFDLLSRYYRIMSDNSLMFWQLPLIKFEVRDLMVSWIEKINEKYRGKLELRFVPYYVAKEKLEDQEFTLANGKFMLRKLSGAPAELPSR